MYVIEDNLRFNLNYAAMTATVSFATNKKAWNNDEDDDDDFDEDKDFLFGENYDEEDETDENPFNDLPDIFRGIIDSSGSSIKKITIETDTYYMDEVLERMENNDNDDETQEKYTPLNIVIPPTIEYNGNLFEVVRIVEYGFYKCQSLLSVTIPSTVKTIGDKAFYSCANLRAVKLYEGIQVIGVSAFRYCKKLVDVKFPSSIIDIRDLAFSRTGLVSVKLPKNLEVLNYDVFEHCNFLQTIYIPAKLISITTDNNFGERIGPFHTCPNLNYIIVDKKNPEFDSRQDCNGIIHTPTNTLLFACPGTTIPDGVVKISEKAYSRRIEYDNIFIPSTVRYIEKNLEGVSFLSIHVAKQNPYFDSRDNCNALIETATNTLLRGCNKTKIPDGIEEFKYKAFENCENLKHLRIPASLRKFNYSSFIDCQGLETIQVDEKNPYFDSRNDCNALIETNTNTLCLGSKKTIIPDGVTMIGANAFIHSKIKSIVIPNSVTEIDSYAFFACKNLKEVTLSKNLKLINTYAFSQCSALKSITIPDGVVFIGQSAFANCNNLKEVFLPDSLKEIEDAAFRNCSALSSIVIPKNVKVIGSSIFDGCEKLSTVNIESDLFYIPSEAFRHCTNLTYIGLPDSIEHIYIEAFAFCDNLSFIVLPKNLKCIEGGALRDCKKLKSVIFPIGIEKVGKYIVKNSNSLKTTIYENGIYLGNANFPYLVLADIQENAKYITKVHPETKVIADFLPVKDII